MRNSNMIFQFIEVLFNRDIFCSTIFIRKKKFTDAHDIF